MFKRLTGNLMDPALWVFVVVVIVVFRALETRNVLGIQALTMPRAAK